ncbi:fluoride efflux transporter CrcB [Tropicimonas sp. S265A]|uniref:fluoride efflux transporter CrcB n=1 Tax=Tropicimonas sp. S265A TaxID=3415134 RepID=UPI003C7B8ABD
MMTSLVQVALGGAIGASCRWLLGLAIVRTFGMTPLPVAVMAANVLGSFVMGLFVVLAAQRGLTHLSPLVMTGLLGGFTTFSAFSLETVTLLERGQMGLAAIYVLLSVVLSVGGLMVGLWVARGVFA